MPGLVWPNGGSLPTVTSEFGQRFHPIDKVWRLHGGIDLVGFSTVRSPFDGQVIYAEYGYNGGFGNLVKIRNASGVVAYLAHNARFLVGYGAWVSAGDAVAIMGTTGASTGVHCHYEVHPGGGAPINPRDFHASASGGGGNAIGEDVMNAAQEAKLDNLIAIIVGSGPSIDDPKWNAGSGSLFGRIQNIAAHLFGGGISSADPNYLGSPGTVYNMLKQPVERTVVIDGKAVTSKIAQIQDNADTNTMVRTLLARAAGEVDEAALAASLAPILAPLLADHLDGMTDDDISRLAKAAADESDRRERARLAE